jgi:hypothetical protein
MEVEEIQDNHGDQPVQDDDSGLTVSLSSSEGANSVNLANQMVIFGEEVHQPIDQIVEQQALGFQHIGQGLLNLIEAYQDVDEEEVIEADNVNNEDDFMLEDVNLLHPNEAHLQIGMVQTHFFRVNEQSSVCQYFSKEGMEIWDKYFAPHIASNSASSKQGFQILVSWFNFITLMLMTPERSDWTIHFLNSSLWEIIKEQIQNEISKTFVIPDKCIVQQAPSCKLLEEGEFVEDDIGLDEDKSRPPAAPKRKRRTKLPLVDSEVRRSPRIVELNEGFKNHSNCKDKNCLTCNAAPPTLHNKLVKNLGVSFCKVGEEEIEKKLLRKGKLPDKDKVIGKATGKGVKSSGSSSPSVCAQQMKKKIFK